MSERTNWAPFDPFSGTLNYENPLSVWGYYFLSLIFLIIYSLVFPLGITRTKWNTYMHTRLARFFRLTLLGYYIIFRVANTQSLLPARALDMTIFSIGLNLCPMDFFCSK